MRTNIRAPLLGFPAALFRELHSAVSAEVVGQIAERAENSELATAQRARHQLFPKNVPSFAVARKRGTGSSSANADVNAFERDHMVRGSNSGYFGVK